ncbi:MAG: hypothetical protein NVV59_11495 [Chitinophagaceae bacterium]|nr:hypothetical protein [Chitinophagaceae bacterium]
MVDYRNIPWMQGHGTPVVMDVTHSLQQPNQTSGVTGGNPQLIGTIAKAAIAAGADGLFIETHPQPRCRPQRRRKHAEAGFAAGIIEKTGETSGSYS